MAIIKADDVTFEYIRRDEEGNVEGITTAVDKVSFTIEKGILLQSSDITDPVSPHWRNI